MMEWEGSEFHPWGGLVPCADKLDCYSANYGADPGFWGNCVEFVNDVPSRNISAGHWCVCNIAFGRIGDGCSQVKRESTIHGLVVGVFLIVSLIVLKGVAGKLGTLFPIKKINSKVATMYLAVLSCFVQALWMLARFMLFLPYIDLGGWHLILVGWFGALNAVTVTAIALVWRSTLSLAKMRKSKAKGHGWTVLAIVVICSVIGTTIFALAMSGKYALTALALIAYYLLVFFVYIGVGCRIHKMIGSMHMATGSDYMAIERIRIKDCIRDVCVFVLLFSVSAVIYSRTNPDEKATSVDVPLASNVCLIVVNLGGLWLNYRIAQYITLPRQFTSSTVASVVPETGQMKTWTKQNNETSQNTASMASPNPSELYQGQHI